MADLSIFKLDNQTITIKDTTARQAAESAKTLSTTASGNATTALNKVTELESEISALKSDIPTKTSDLTNDSDFMSGMTILAYGKSTWADFIAAYTAKHVVYCRASSDSNPASGSQTRMAFMAYVNDESSPTNVEFQYYRSIKSHSATQQGDQVYVYTLDKTAGWTVTVRECYTRIVAGTGITATYSNGVLTIAEQTLANKLYPVGSIYMSVNATNPAELFGGTWEQIKDRFLLAAGDTYAVESTGGEAQHTLTVDEMPSHGHKIDQLWTESPGNNQLAHGGAGYSLKLNQNKTTSLTGGGEPHNNMPPYLAVYMWKRTA